MHKKLLYIFLVALIFTLGSAYRFSKKVVTADKKFIVVLDAGHGGTDPGTLGTGRYKTSEKDIALDVTLKVVQYFLHHKAIASQKLCFGCIDHTMSTNES